MATHPGASRWPRLAVEEWTQTRHTLHMLTQIVGKVRMVRSPMVNHWWQVTLYVSARGLTTGNIPCGHGSADIEFDFIDHVLRIRSSGGDQRHVGLTHQSVAGYYAEIMSALADLGIEAGIDPRPNEVEPAIPFARDTEHRTYDPDAAQSFWRQLVQADRVLQDFRSRFIGKASPVHFFWGAMDLACTRFSGRTAPTHPGGVPHVADSVMVEGYSHEVMSCGFWPGGGKEGAFYAYAYPEPPGFRSADPGPAATWSEEFSQFLLPYEAAAESADPDAMVLAFMQSVYEAAASGAGWDRQQLETDPSRWPTARPAGPR